jgi:hypothetical protein
VTATTHERPLGLRHHMRSAAAACEGRANFHAKHHQGDADLFNALADLFYEHAEHIDHDCENPVARELLAVADVLNRMED